MVQEAVVGLLPVVGEGGQPVEEAPCDYVVIESYPLL